MTIAIEDVTAAIEKVVAEKGEDHHYDSSSNTPHKGEVGLPYSYDDCIVGCVIRELDPALHEQFLDAEKRARHGFSLMHVEDYTGAPCDALDALQVRVGYAGYEALSVAQNRQDSGKTWGVALAAYKDTLEHEKGVDE